MERRRGVTRDLMARRSLRPPVPLFGLDEGAALLHRLGPGGLALLPEELLDLFALAERSEAARVAASVPDLTLPDLAGLLAPLADLSDLNGEKDRIFEKFFQGRQGQVPGGTGIGLATCREIVTAHGGTIRAENRPGGGAAFLRSRMTGRLWNQRSLMRSNIKDQTRHRRG